MIGGTQPRDPTFNVTGERCNEVVVSFFIMEACVHQLHCLQRKEPLKELPSSCDNHKPLGKLTVAKKQQGYRLRRSMLSVDRYSCASLVNFRKKVQAQSNFTLRSSLSHPVNSTLRSSLSHPVNSTLRSSLSHPVNSTLRSSLSHPVNCTLRSSMGPVRIRHSSHDFGWQSSHSVDLAGWQAKMASIEFWIPWRDAHKPHLIPSQLHPPFFNLIPNQLHPPFFNLAPSQLHPPFFTLTPSQLHPPFFNLTPSQLHPPFFNLIPNQLHPPFFNLTPNQLHPPFFNLIPNQLHPPFFNLTPNQLHPPLLNLTPNQLHPPLLTLTPSQLHPPFFTLIPNQLHLPLLSHPVNSTLRYSLSHPVNSTVRCLPSPPFTSSTGSSPTLSAFDWLLSCTFTQHRSTIQRAWFRDQATVSSSHTNNLTRTLANNIECELAEDNYTPPSLLPSPFDGKNTLTVAKLWQLTPCVPLSPVWQLALLSTALFMIFIVLVGLAGKRNRAHCVIAFWFHHQSILVVSFCT